VSLEVLEGSDEGDGGRLLGLHRGRGRQSRGAPPEDAVGGEGEHGIARRPPADRDGVPESERCADTDGAGGAGEDLGPQDVVAATRSVRITGLPCSPATRAWIRVPECSPASMTIVASPYPDIVALRIGNKCFVGGASG